MAERTNPHEGGQDPRQRHRRHRRDVPLTRAAQDGLPDGPAGPKSSLRRMSAPGSSRADGSSPGPIPDAARPQPDQDAAKGSGPDRETEDPERAQPELAGEAEQRDGSRVQIGETRPALVLGADGNGAGDGKGPPDGDRPVPADDGEGEQGDSEAMHLALALHWLPRSSIRDPQREEAEPQSSSHADAADVDSFLLWEEGFQQDAENGDSEHSAGATAEIVGAQQSAMSVIELVAERILERSTQDFAKIKTASGKFDVERDAATNVKPPGMLILTKHKMTLPGLDKNVALIVNIGITQPVGETAKSYVNDVTGFWLDEEGRDYPEARKKVIAYMKEEPSYQHESDDDIEMIVLLASAAEQARLATLPSSTPVESDNRHKPTKGHRFDEPGDLNIDQILNAGLPQPSPEQPEQNERKLLPRGLHGLRLEMLEKEKALIRLLPFARPQAENITRPEQGSETETEGASELSLGGESRYHRERMLETMGRAVYEMEKIAFAMIDPEKITRQQTHLTTQNGDSAILVVMEPKDPSEQIQEATPHFVWHDAAAAGTQDRRLMIQTARVDQEYTDPDNPSATKKGTINTTFLYDILASGEVRLVALGFEHFNKAGVEERSKLLDVYSQSAANYGFNADETEEAFTISRAFAEMVDAYAAFYTPKPETIENAELTMSEEIGDQDMLGHEIVVTMTQTASLMEASGLLAGQDQGELTGNPGAFGEAYLGLLALRARVNGLRKEQGETSVQGMVSKTSDDALRGVLASYREALEQSEDVPEEIYARRELIEASLRGYDTMGDIPRRLSDEHDDLERSVSRPDTVKPGDHKILEAVIKQCEQLGLDPTDLNGQDLIKKYSISPEDAWQLRFNHFRRLHEADRDPEHMLGKEVVKLLVSDTLLIMGQTKLSDRFVFETIPDAMPLMADPTFRLELAKRFSEVMTNVPLTTENARKIAEVGREVLQSEDEGLIFMFGNQFADIAEGPRTDSSDPDEKSKVHHQIAQGKFAWDMALRARYGAVPEDLVTNVIAGVKRNGFDRNYLLDMVAEQYAARGDFAGALEIIGTMDSAAAEAAYYRSWERAKTIEELGALTPVNFAEMAANNRLLEMDFIATAALLANNPTMMGHAAEDTARDLRAGDESDQPVAHKEHHFRKLRNLVRKAKEAALEKDPDHGHVTAVDLSLNVLTIFATDGGKVPFDQLTPVMDTIATSGTTDDWAVVKNLIFQQQISNTEKVRLLTEFAMRMR